MCLWTNLENHFGKEAGFTNTHATTVWQQWPTCIRATPGGETGASDSTSELVQDGETNDGTRGSGNSLELEDDHTMEENLEESHHEDSSEVVQLAIVNDTISEVNQPNAKSKYVL